MITKQSVVTWFSSRKNTAIFFVACFTIGTLIGVYRIAFSLAPEKIDGPATLSCTESQPAGDIQRTTEFFILNCPHCEKTEEYLHSIPGGVIRRHLVWDTPTELMARMVYALEEMDRDDAVHMAELAVLSEKWIFDYTTNDASRFAHENGLDIVKLATIETSAGADRFIADTKRVQKACGIMQAPTLLKKGVIVTAYGAGGYKQMVEKAISL